ncbi:hypothetical protein MRX96_002193 [Rhipicephalus microplus]
MVALCLADKFRSRRFLLRISLVLLTLVLIFIRCVLPPIIERRERAALLRPLPKRSQSLHGSASECFRSDHPVVDTIHETSWSHEDMWPRKMLLYGRPDIFQPYELASGDVLWK